MEKLPKELLIEVFSYLCNRDILEMTLVCKYFNSIIEDSTYLRRRIRLNLHARSIASKEWIGSRNYSQVMLKDSSKKSLNILKIIASNISNLRIMFGRMYMKSLKKIFLRAKNLKDLSIIKMDLVDTDEDYEGELPKLNLNSLTYNGCKSLFKLLKYCSLQSLSIYSVYNTPTELCYLKNFLKSQTSLKSLKFTSFNQEWMLFDDEVLSNVDFRLQKLSLHSLIIFDLKFFKSFLLNHKSTLKDLTLRHDYYNSNFKPFHDEIFEILSNFSCLKVLTLHHFNLPNRPLPSVKSLTIQNISKMNFPEICLNFPNLQDLNVSSIREIKADLTSLTQLNTVTFENTKILNLSLPLIKRITLSDMFLEAAILNKNNFSEVIVDNCEELQTLIDFLKITNTKLNLLKIESCDISKSQKDFISSLSGCKVKNLIIAHCNVIDIEHKKLKAE